MLTFCCAICSQACIIELTWLGVESKHNAIDTGTLKPPFRTKLNVTTFFTSRMIFSNRSNNVTMKPAHIEGNKNTFKLVYM